MPSGWRSSSSRRSKKLAKLAELGARQISRTDPDGRFLHQADDFVLGYTADLAVSDDHRIVAQRTTQAVSDSASLLAMVDRVMEACGEWPGEVSADIEQGEVRKEVFGPTLFAATTFDEGVVPDIRKWFEAYYTIQFANYPVDDHYLAHGSTPVPCRR